PALGWSATGAGLFVQSLIAPLSHGAWTGLVGAALWQNRSQRSSWPRIGAAILTSTFLHALWDLEGLKNVFRSWLPWANPSLVFPGLWQPVIGIVGLFLVRETFWRGLLEQGHSLLALDPEMASSSRVAAGIACLVCSQVSLPGMHYCPLCGAVLVKG